MLTQTAIESACRQALAEDIGAGDATTLAVVPDNLEVSGAIVARQGCVCAGLRVAETVFRQLNPAAAFEACVNDGDACEPGAVLARITGRARAVLTGERTALNFLQRLSGIATITRQYVDAVGKHQTRILDTRKTTPSLRVFEKYAVTCGGGVNHRMGLYDRVMIKDNHREIARMDGPDGISAAVRRCRERYPHLEIEVEADTLEEVQAAADAAADYILLDNMSDEEVGNAVSMVAGRALLEASGGITLERIPELARTGVDFISVGALTHSAPAVDIALDLDPLGRPA